MEKGSQVGVCFVDTSIGKIHVSYLLLAVSNKRMSFKLYDKSLCKLTSLKVGTEMHHQIKHKTIKL